MTLEEPAVLGCGIHEKPRNGLGMVSSFHLQELPGALPHRYSRGEDGHEEQGGSIPLAILHPAAAPPAAKRDNSAIFQGKRGKSSGESKVGGGERSPASLQVLHSPASLSELCLNQIPKSSC